MRLNQVTVGCTDYAASVAFYTALGLTQIVDAPPRYARFETPSGETFSIHHADQVIAGTTVVYFEIEQLDQTVAILKSAGLRFNKDPVDETWGWREARLHDPAGNEICLFRAGPFRRFPPWRIDGKTED
ncbi:VOC family protein [Erythrobacter dokdonensis]|uniref:Glyoxalase family protein n=1 Tax=Erythrobacter dokdonensis DSW-74 TaxID=1300349 RepID=A0A1A7BJC3_9SPHN|nr:VOC family protein [Erythrobacter dokdonensis]OBV12658.1 Glyoxalase family protein [Erythrobacter dokdonensis DSW-74]